MKILVVGKGGRESAIGWKLSQNQEVELYFAPGNPGTQRLGSNLPFSDIPSILQFAREKKVDWIFVGPEEPLTQGIVDQGKEEGVRVFGPSRQAAQLEASKSFAKGFMRRHGIPTAPFEVFTDAASAEKYARQKGFPIVLKADGLAGGKGAFVLQSPEECQQVIENVMLKKTLGKAGDKVVIEEYLSGEEGSFLAFIHVSGKNAMAHSFPICQDHKRLLDKDEGPNTGGMGAYAPADHLNSYAPLVKERILFPTLMGLLEEGMDYTGVLYVGLMFTEEGPEVLEYNVRMGDPEAQALLPLLQSDLANTCFSLLNGEEPGTLQFAPNYALCVVLASEGYPSSPRKGERITGIEEAEKVALVFHAGTGWKDGALVTDGGRILNVVGIGNTLTEAKEKAYAAAEKIQFQGKILRYDIGRKALQHAGTPH